MIDAIKGVLVATDGLASALRAEAVAIRQVLEATEERAEGAGVADLRLVSDHGDLAKAILAIAERKQVDLVVMGQCGVSAISQFLLGSVLKSIIDNAPCAVSVAP